MELRVLSILFNVSFPLPFLKSNGSLMRSAVLKDEMESVMKLIGIKDLSEVHPGLVNTSDVDHLVPSGSEHPYAKWRPKANL